MDGHIFFKLAHLYVGVLELFDMQKGGFQRML